MFKVGELVQLLPEYAKQVSTGSYAVTPIEPRTVRSFTMKYGSPGAIDISLEGEPECMRWVSHFRRAEGPW